MSSSRYLDREIVHPREFDLFGSVRIRVLASIAVCAGWLTLLLLFLAFWAERFSLFQVIVLIVVSVLLAGAILLSLWISFGMRFLRI